MFLCPATEMPCNGHIKVVAMAWLCCVTVNKEIAYLKQWIFAYSREKKKVLKLMKLTLIQKVIYVSELLIIHSKRALYMGIGNDSKLS